MTGRRPTSPFLRIVLTILACLLVAGLALSWRIEHELTRVKVARVRIDSDHLEGGRPLRIMQISDFHNGRGPSAQRILEKVEREQPQAVLLTGDHVHGTPGEDLGPLTELLSGLTWLGMPVYAVWGNHDHWSGRLDELTVLFRRHRVTLLQNQHTTVRLPRGRSFTLVGVDDYSTGNGDLATAMRGVDPRRFTLVMSHAPAISRDLGRHRIDLVVVGHTHGGQVRIPFKGCVLAPDQGYWPKLCHGLHTVQGTRMWIDTGLGWSVRRVRLNAPAQVTMFTIHGRG